MTTYQDMIRAAAGLWEPGYTQPFDDMLDGIPEGAEDGLGRYGRAEYARGQVELIVDSAHASFPSMDEAKPMVAVDIRNELMRREYMKPAEKVAAVIEAMRTVDGYTVLLDDIELWMHLEHFEESLDRPIAETFAFLRAQGFDLSGSDKHTASHYWDATHDWVSDNLEKHGLRRLVFEAVEASFYPEAWINDNATPTGDPVETWDATEYANENTDYVTRMFRGHEDDQDVVDKDDVFQRDPNAPGNVQEWEGPFTIRLVITPE